MTWSVELPYINAVMPAVQAQSPAEGTFESGAGLPEGSGASGKTIDSLHPAEVQEIIRSGEVFGIATKDQRCLKINGFDKTQLDALTALAEQIDLNPAVEQQYTAGNLPKDLAERVNVKELAKYDRRLIRSLIHLCTPVEQGGGGHEFVDVISLVRGHTNAKDKVDNDEEGAPPEGEDEKQSTHHVGRAADVGAIDYLRGTEFTIETKDGKPTVKSTKHLPLDPIQVGWQINGRPAGARDGGSPRLNGSSAGTVGSNAIAGNVLAGLQQGFDRSGADIDLNRLIGSFGPFGNLGELAKLLGDGYLPEVLGSQVPLFTGPYGLRQTGQQAIADAFGNQIPSFGLFGKTLAELEYNVGREHITSTLGLPEGALLGQTSGDVIKNAGERFWEAKLGDLPLGTLDGTTTDGSPEERRADLERRIGRGRVAKLLGLDVGSIPLGASGSAFQTSLGLAWDDLQAGGHTFSHQLGIPTEDSIAQIQQNPDEWLRKVGRVQLGAIEAYLPSARDAAFNLEARPTILNLPIGTIQEKSEALLRDYAFKSGVNVAALLETNPTDAELRGWLLVNAYVKGSDPNQSLITDKFLGLDPFAFYHTGIEVLAKAMTSDNAARQGLRTYLRTGQEPSDGTLDLTYIAQTTGFPDRSDFDAVFRNNAPVVGFSHVGRLLLSRVTSSSPEQVALFTAKSVGVAPDQLADNLQTVREALVKTRRADLAIRDHLDPGIASIDTLLALLEQGKGPLGLTLSPEWRGPVASIQRAAQAVASSRGGLEGARDLLLATNGLFGQPGLLEYTTEKLALNLPGGAQANRIVRQILNGDLSAKEGVERIGGFPLDDALNLRHGDSYNLYRSVQAQLDRRDTAGAVATIAHFAATNNEELQEVVYGVELAVRQLGNPTTFTPETFVKGLLNGRITTPLGNEILGAGLGMSRAAPLGTVLKNTTGNLNEPVMQSIGARSLAEVITGSDLLFDSIPNPYQNLIYSTVSTQTGQPVSLTGPEFDDDPARYISSILGHEFSRADTTKLGITDTTPTGLSAFAREWKPWEDPALTARLTSIVKAGFPELGELPNGTLEAIFSSKLSEAERTQRLEHLAKSQINARLLDPFLNDVLGIPGVPSGAVIAAKNILLSNAPESEKSAALQSLGRATADAVATAQFGFPISWLMDGNLDPKVKVRIGLGIASQSLGLDPALTTIVDQAWQTFFIDGGIDTTTAAGRTQLAGLVGAVGAAAGVPAEYAGVAAAFITGDVEATALAYAGGQFNQVLQENGIFTVGFADIYQALAGPSRSTIDQFKLEVDAELASRFQNDPAQADKYEEIHAALADDLLQGKLTNFREKKQEQLMFAGMDLALSKSLGIPGIGGMARAFMRGSFTDQAAATGQLISAISGSPEAAIILGNAQLVDDLRKFTASGNLSDISSASYASLDGWMSSATGVPIPQGTSEVVVGFASTGDVAKLEAVANADTLVAFGGGYLDQAVGLPGGSTASMYSAYKNLEAANAAIGANSLVTNFEANLALTGNPGEAWNAAINERAAALQNVQLAQAGLITTGVNILFGETFAKLDNSLGLPSGTLSTLVSTGIYAAMVPGIALGQLLMTTVLPWAAPLLLAAAFGIDIQGILGGIAGFFGLGSLFGGGKKQEQKIILWSSYTGKWPEEIEYLCRDTSEPALKDDDKRPKGQVVERKLEKQTVQCEVGKQIVFAKTLPPNVFYGPPPSNVEPNYQAGKYEAANTKVQQFIGSLLWMPVALNDDAMTPGQIRSHKKEHGEINQTLMDHFQTWGDGDVGSYLDSISEGVLKKRTGYLFDEPNKVPYFTEHVHWNY